MSEAPIEAWLDEHAEALRRLAAQVVRDAHRADDLVQATWLRALLWRGAHPTTAVRAWLSTILRNEARRAHRDEMRRARREEIAARPEGLDGIDRELDRAAVLRALLDALDSLPTAMREAVMLRHLDGLPLRKVAARQGVPVRTAETRIHRGLERLRARLDGRFGSRSTWLPFLAPWAVGGEAIGLATAILTMKGKLALAAAAVAIGWVVWPRDAERVILAEAPRDAVLAPQRIATTATAEPTPDAVADALARTPAPVPEERAAMVTGRIVDAAHRPLAGATVRLSGRSRDPETGQQWLLEQGRFVWEDPAPVTTGADGRFELRCDPPPPFAFHWSAQADGLARLSARLGALDPGATRDLGDVVLVAGARLAGRIVDADGTPQGGAQFMIRSVETDGTVEEPFIAAGGFTWAADLDGSFEAPGYWWPGEYEITVADQPVLEPAGTVRVDAPATTVRLVVPRVPPGDLIVGVVADEAGRPLSGVEFRAAGSRRRGYTWHGGVFRLVREQGDRQPNAHVRFSRKGRADIDVDLAWGTADARVMMPRGDVFVLHVTEPGGRPVEAFAVRRADPAPELGFVPVPPQLMHAGVHDGGRLELPHDAGRRLVRVEPQPSSGLWPSPFVRVERGAGGAQDLVIALQPPGARELRLVDGQGRPIAGARVELVEELPGLRFDLDAVALDRLRLEQPRSSAWAIGVDRVTTDHDGRTTLHGPFDRELALRVSGPGCVPFVVRGVRLDAREPLLLRGAAGGRLHGKLGPVEVIGDLRAQAGVPREGAVENDTGVPVVRLVRQVDGRREEWPPASRGGAVELSDDGRFTIADVPPGDWRIELRSWYQTGAGRASDTSELDVTVRLRSGEEQRVEATLPPRAGFVAVRTALDDRRGRVAMVRFVPIGTSSRDEGGRSFQVDQVGHTLAILPPGEWRGILGIHVPDARGSFEVPSDPAIVVRSGARQEVHLHAAIGALPVRVLQPDGTPAGGVELLHADQGIGCASLPTDADGCTILYAPAGPLTLRTRVRSLAAQGIWNAWWSAHQSDPAAISRAFVPVGTVIVPRGDGAVIELRLPAGWADG